MMPPLSPLPDRRPVSRKHLASEMSGAAGESLRKTVADQVRFWLPVCDEGASSLHLAARGTDRLPAGTVCEIWASAAKKRICCGLNCIFDLLGRFS